MVTLTKEIMGIISVINSDHDIKNIMTHIIYVFGLEPEITREDCFCHYDRYGDHDGTMVCFSLNNGKDKDLYYINGEDGLECSVHDSTGTELFSIDTDEVSHDEVYSRILNFINKRYNLNKPCFTDEDKEPQQQKDLYPSIIKAYKDLLK